jgi:predicted permease
MLNGLLNDVRYSVRQLRLSPGFTFTAVLTLALAIGATTAVYSIVRGSLLAPLPYPHAEELVGLGFSQPGDALWNGQTGETGDLILAQAKSFASLGIADGGSQGANFSSGNGAQSIHALRVSSGYLPTLGVAPILGHTFTRDEDLPRAAPTVLLSETLWRNSLNADPHIVGKVIHLNEDAYTVIGVMPSRFATVDSPDVWTPLHLSPEDAGYQGTNYTMIARLKPGVSLAQASTEMNLVNAAVYRKFPYYTQYVNPGAPLLRQYVWPLHEIVVSSARTSLIALAAAVGAVLLLACLNLAGLMTARSIARRGEIALRTALGASRGQTLRLLLTESLLLAIAGSALGIALAAVAVPILVLTSPIDVTAVQVPGLDWTSLVFAVVAGCGTTLVFGLIPAMTVFRQAVGAQIGNARTAGETVSQQQLGKSLIVAQVGLATAMLSAGALLLSAFVNMRAIPSGVRPQHLYALQVNLKGDAYTSATHTQQFLAGVENRLRQIPGVAQVSAVNGLPLDGGLNDQAGAADRKDQLKNSEIRFVTPGYFHTVGLTILQGQDVSDANSANTAPVALINDLAAKQWFPGRNAIGEYVLAADRKTPRRVIGVTASTHNHALADRIRPTAYVPIAQLSDEQMKTINGWFPTTFVIRAQERAGAADPNIAKAAEAAIAAVDPEVPAAKFAPMQSFVDKSVAAPRFFSWLAGGFAVFALGLTLIGLFGLLSYQVSSRTRELGVRMALGAQRGQILSLVLRNGLVVTSIGLVLGIAGSFALRGVISSLLYTVVDGLGRADSVSILGNRSVAIALSAAAMLIATVAASLIPARRAAYLEPTEALRAE